MSDLTSSQETYEERLRDNSSGGFENSFTINPNKPNIAGKIKRFGGHKIISAFLSMIVLVGGLGIGVILVEQPQLFAQSASTIIGNSCIDECKLGTTSCDPKLPDKQFKCVQITKDGVCPAHTKKVIETSCSSLGNFSCNVSTGKCERICKADTPEQKHLPPVGQYTCQTSGENSYGGVAQVELTKDSTDPMCPDYKSLKIVDECKAEKYDDAFMAHTACATGISYGRNVNGYLVTRAHTKIYNPGGAACVTKAIVKPSPKN